MTVSEPFPRPVVVPVGSDPVDAALRFAAAEAGRAGCGVHLLHAFRLAPQGPEAPLVERVSAGELGRQTLHAALERARDIVPEGTPVTGTVVVGATVPAVVHAADAARMVVLEHRDLSRLQRLVHRSVTSGVAAHTRVPVVAVPAGWDRSSAEPSVVTVGVDRPERSELVLRAGFEAARARDASLRIVHAWGPAVSHYELAVSGIDVEQWDARATAEVREAVQRLPRDLTEGVSHDIVVRHSDPASLLVEVSGSSDLVVIGRHDPVIPVGSHIGPVARGVLRAARSPVLLADPRRT